MTSHHVRRPEATSVNHNSFGLGVSCNCLHSSRISAATAKSKQRRAAWEARTACGRDCRGTAVPQGHCSGHHCQGTDLLSSAYLWEAWAVQDALWVLPYVAFG